MFNAFNLSSLIVSDEDHSCELLLPLAETPDTTLKTIVQPVYKINCFPRILELSTPKHFSAMRPALESEMHQKGRLFMSWVSSFMLKNWLDGLPMQSLSLSPLLTYLDIWENFFDWVSKKKNRNQSFGGQSKDEEGWGEIAQRDNESASWKQAKNLGRRRTKVIKAWLV